MIINIKSMNNTTDIYQKPEVIKWTQIILNSYQKLLGKELINRDGNPLKEAEELFYAPIVVLSHNTDSDPIYNYGNLQALNLWELSWDELLKTPSKSTTEVMLRSEREKILKEVATKGYVENYGGIRKSKNGKKYKLENVIVWNLTDEENQYCGQAATFSEWENL